MNIDTLEKDLIKKAVKKNIPISGTLELLPLCNMNCDMCYVQLSQSEMEYQGRLRTAEEWIELGRQMKDNGVLFLQLTGGEPLLYPEFKKVYLALKKMGIVLTLNTNGTLINETWANFFSQYKPRRINITLYGSCEETYQKICHYREGFTKALHAIKLLKERNIDVKINGTLVKSNQHELENLLDIACGLNTPIHIDTYMCPATRERMKPYNFQSRLTPMEAAKAEIFIHKYSHSEEDFHKFIEHFLHKVNYPSLITKSNEQMQCLAGRSSFAINWQGNMQPCVMMKTPFISVFNKSFKDAWEIISYKVKNIYLNQTCVTCTKRDVCKTCAACAFYEGGNFDRIPKYICQYMEKLILLLEKELSYD